MQITLFASPSISFRQMRDGPTLPSIPGFDAYHVQTKSMEGDQSKVVFVPTILKGLSHEIDFKNFDKNLQNMTELRDAAGF